MSEMIGRAGCPGEEKAADEEGYAGDDAGVGIPVFCFIVAVGAIDGVEDQDTACCGDHTIREYRIAKIIVCAPDGPDLFVMKGHAVEKNAVMAHFRDGAGEPLMIDGLHVELIPYGVSANVGASFF